MEPSLFQVSVLVMLVSIVGARTVSLAAADAAVAVDVSGSGDCPYAHKNKRATGDMGH